MHIHLLAFFDIGLCFDKYLDRVLILFMVSREFELDEMIIGR